MLSSGAWTAVGALVVATIVASVYRSHSAYKWNKEFLDTGMERPPLWIYVNEGDVNARWWADFGARSNRALNIPLYNLCYESIVKHCGAMYRVEVIRGLQDLAVRLGGWEALPAPLRNRLAPVGKSEVDWIRSCVLAKWGGLWVSPTVVCIRDVPIMPRDTVVGFGTDWTVDNAGPDGTAGPGSRILWSPAPQHPIFVEWERVCRKRIEEAGGGRQVRTDFTEDWARLVGAAGGAQILGRAEVDRKGRSGRRIDTSDLLAAGTEGRLPFTVGSEAYFVPIDIEDMKARRNYGWILKMSETQILESDLVISHLLRGAL